MILAFGAVLVPLFTLYGLGMERVVTAPFLLPLMIWAWFSAEARTPDPGR